MKSNERTRGEEEKKKRNKTTSTSSVRVSVREILLRFSLDFSRSYSPDREQTQNEINSLMF